MNLRFWRRKLPADLPATPQFTAEDVIRASYQAILSREPDDAGLAAQTEALARRPDRLARVLRAFLAGPESAEVNRPLLLSGLGAVDVTVVSLGTHCFASEFLKRQGLRSWAGPFDWIFSNTAMVEHCIRDDFATFLDRSQYRPVPLAQRRDGADVGRVDHVFYLTNYRVRHVFNHHDVHDDKDYAYLRRCVDRFRGALHSPDPHVFLLVTRALPDATQAVRSLSASLAQAGSRHRLLAFLVDDSPSTRVVPEVRVEVDDASLTIMQFASVSRWQPLRFTDPIDELVLSKLLRDTTRRASRSN